MIDHAIKRYKLVAFACAVPLFYPKSAACAADKKPSVENKRRPARL
jgi:hypothetical protein